jgi:hypothetical protein
MEPNMSKKKQQNEVAIESPTTNEEATVVSRSYAQLIESFKTKSGVIRGLHAEGKAAKDIYKILKDLKVTNNEGTHPIRYQHVRNVLNTPIKKQG